HYAATCIRAEARTLKKALSRILEVVCDTLQWEVGAFWCVDGPAEVLRCTESYESPAARLPSFLAAARDCAVPPGAGLLGRVWRAREPLWGEQPDLVQDGPCASLMKQLGLRACFGLPVLSGKEVYGILTLFSRQTQQPNEHLRDILFALGGQLGQFIQRKRAEEQLRQAK